MTKIWSSLQKFGLVSEDTVQLFSTSTRDNAKLNVWRDSISEVIFIRDHYIGDQKYVSSGYVSESPVDVAPLSIEEQRNLERRLRAFRGYARGKDICDFGCGSGLFLEGVKDECASSLGIELQLRHLKAMQSKGIKCTSSMDDISDQSLDSIFSFHVIEHLPDPTASLGMLKRKLRPGGFLIVEVPHARDFLLSDSIANQAFKEFTLWSQHLILHTRASLSYFLKDAGFEIIEISGIQRYPLSNHLYWLAHQKPGGHLSSLAEIDSSALDKAYTASLARLDRNDTLIAIARRP